nr:hypothetical protein [Endozoicomonas sp.]
MTSLLIAETPHQVVPSLAAEIGLNECLFLQQLHWILQEKDCYSFDDRLWWKHTNAQWLERMPYFSERTLLRIIQSLKKQGLLVTENLAWKIQKIRGDRTNWYTINYQKLELISTKIRTEKASKIKLSAEKNTAEAPVKYGYCQNGSMAPCQNGIMTQSQNGSMIKETYIKDLEVVVNAVPAPTDFDFDEAFPIVLNMLDERVETASLQKDPIIRSIWMDYKAGATSPSYSGALRFMTTGLKQYEYSQRRSIKLKKARDGLASSRTDHIDAQADQAARKAQEINGSHRSTAEKLTDRTWAEGLQFEDAE